MNPELIFLSVGYILSKSNVSLLWEIKRWRSSMMSLPLAKNFKLYPQNVEFEGPIPLLKKEDAEFVEHANTEPLREECSSFPGMHPIQKQPLTNAQSGIDVLKVLHACQQSIEQNGVPVSL
jgi:hypothetical protein